MRAASPRKTSRAAKTGTVCGQDRRTLAVSNGHLLALGLRPPTRSDGLLAEVRKVAARYPHRADLSKIISRPVWRAGLRA